MPVSEQKSSYDQRNQQVEQQTNVAGNYYAGDEAYDVRGLTNPYLGLKAFTYAERTRFAGREEEVARAVALVTKAGAERTLLFVTGSSGSGKSSFAQAGLLPALESHYQERGFAVKHAIFRPDGQPLAELARAMHALALPLDGVFTPAVDYQLAAPVTTPDPHQISLLIIDQFEELFNQSEVAQRTLMFQILAGLPPFTSGHLHIMATMRADYLPELFEHTTLYDIAKTGIDLRVMSEDKLKVTIQRPLQALHPHSGKRFQTALLNRLAKDSATDAAYLPLLQVTLEDLWRGGVLTIDHYQSLTDAIRKRADEIYAYRTGPDGTLAPRSPTEQQLMLSVFLDLVDVSFEGDARRDVRRTRRLADVTKGSRDAEALVNELASGRLLAINGEINLEGQQELETVDVIHESLIQNWGRLQGAIQEQRARLQRRRRFELRLNEWLENGRSSGRLLSGVSLEEAIALNGLQDIAVQNRAAQDFLNQSIRERDRSRNRAQQVKLVIAGLIGMVLVVGGRLAVDPIQKAMWHYRAANSVPMVDIAALGIQFEAHEVTNERYEWCVKAGQCIETDYLRRERVGSDWEETKHRPVRGATANQAISFCEWIGRTLPTAGQWLVVAPPVYKWKTLGPEMAVFCREDKPCPEAPLRLVESGNTIRIPQYSVANNATGTGVFDLVGNVREWTRTSLVDVGSENLYCSDLATISDEELFVILGNGFNQIQPSEIGNYRHMDDTQVLRTSNAKNLGFRCVTRNEVSSDPKTCPPLSLNPNSARADHFFANTRTTIGVCTASTPFT